MIINDINIIKKALKNKDQFSQRELIKLLRGIYPATKENTLKWKIFQLKENGVIQHVARGIYSLAEQKKPYTPGITPETKELYKSLQKELPYTELSIAHTSWFNEFMVHQVFKTYLIIEAEKDAAATVFNRLTAQDKKAFLNPGPEIFEYYITNTENTIIVKTLISESPLVELDHIKLASLEKLLVDCVCDNEIYGAQYQEASVIFKNAINKYSVNINKMKRYARRSSR